MAVPPDRRRPRARPSSRGMPSFGRYAECSAFEDGIPAGEHEAGWWMCTCGGPFTGGGRDPFPMRLAPVSRPGSRGSRIDGPDWRGHPLRQRWLVPRGGRLERGRAQAPLARLQDALGRSSREGVHRSPDGRGGRSGRGSNERSRTAGPLRRSAPPRRNLRGTRAGDDPKLPRAFLRGVTGKARPSFTLRLRKAHPEDTPERARARGGPPA